jgi:trimethylamine:corrinoid methyltransferase-like protein
MKNVITKDQIFLSEEHTVRYMRLGAVWMSKIGNWNQNEDGENIEGVLAGARAQARDILKTHNPKPLPEAVLAELDHIMERASRELIRA